MRYILLKGASHAGKSNTVNAVSKLLRPSSIRRLGSNRQFKVTSIDEEILNGTYIIQFANKCILIVAGAPTEQGITISVLITICMEQNIQIDFVLAVMRSYERSDGFDTSEELRQLGDCILEEVIYKIPGENYKESDGWRARVQRLADLIINN
jgi:hypothetical protein